MQQLQIHVSSILTTMMAPGWTTDRGVDEGVVEGGALLGQQLGSLHHRGHGVQEHILRTDIKKTRDVTHDCQITKKHP